MTDRPSNLFIICLLGVLSVISPFAIDMYLPAYAVIAREFDVPNATIALTLSSYFIGMAAGQLFYGPLLDRFGRKRPLLGGLCLFVAASIACAMVPGIEAVIALRFVQAVGGCAAGVASLAMVRDFFPVNEGAKILSRMFLFISVSPLLAPTIGGAVALAFGWKAVFVLLAVIVAAIAVLIWRFLPEGHVPDESISLRPGPIFREYMAIFAHPRFRTYALAGAFSFAGLFTYVAGSPIIFMDGFGLSAEAYSVTFALLAFGFLGASQVNVVLLKRYDSETLFRRMLAMQALTGLVFVAGSAAELYGLYATLAMFFLFLSCIGLTYPNAAAIALAPFRKNIGSASALLGFLQLGVGALISTGITMADSRGSLPIIVILGVTSCLGLLLLLAGRRRALACTLVD